MSSRIRDDLRAELASSYPGIVTGTETIRKQRRSQRRESRELFSTVGLDLATLSSLNERADSDLDDDGLGDDAGPLPADRARLTRSPGAPRAVPPPAPAAAGPEEAPAGGRGRQSGRFQGRTRSTDRRANQEALLKYVCTEAYKAFAGKGDDHFDTQIGLSSSTYIPAPSRRVQLVLKQRPFLLALAASFVALGVAGLLWELAKTAYGVYWLVFKPLIFLGRLTARLALYVLQTLSVGCALYYLASLPDLFATYAAGCDLRRAYLHAGPGLELGDLETPDISQSASVDAGDEDEDSGDAGPAGGAGDGAGEPKGRRATLREIARSLFAVDPDSYLLHLRCSRIVSTLPELALSRIFCPGMDVTVPPFPPDRFERLIWCLQLARFSLTYTARYFWEVYLSVLRLLCSSYRFVRGARDRTTAACVAVATALALYSPVAPLLSLPLLGPAVLGLRTLAFLLLFVVNLGRTLAWQYRAWLRPLLRAG